MEYQSRIQGKNTLHISYTLIFFMKKAFYPQEKQDLVLGGKAFVGKQI